MTILLAFCFLFLSGCMAFWSHTQPVNTAVSDEAQGQDCSQAIFGLGFGTNTVEKAMAAGYPKPITRIRSVELHNNFVFFIAGQCIIVHGETGLVADTRKPDNLASPYGTR